MGVIRLLLALVVLISHSPQGVIPRFLHPALSVQCFYAISGFLMQLVIRRYQQSGGQYWYLAFYKSRAFRLLPLYWIFTFLMIVFCNNGLLGGFFSTGDVKGVAIYCLTNLFILGQDILRLLYYNLNTHQFHILPAFTENMKVVLTSHTIFGSSFTIMGQSWTLSVEMWFYLLVPFLLLRPVLEIIGVIVLGIIFRCIWAYYGYTHHTFMYGIILNEIAIFLSGALAARFYRYWLEDGKILRFFSCYISEQNAQWFIKSIGFVVLPLLIWYYCKGWNYFPSGGSWETGFFNLPYKWWAVILFTVLSLPFLFYSMSRLKVDRFIGDLSYPVYISHFFIIALLEKTSLSKDMLVVYTMLLSIAVSIIMIYTVERPIDALRHKLFLKKKAKLLLT